MTRLDNTRPTMGRRTALTMLLGAPAALTLSANPALAARGPALEAPPAFRRRYLETAWDRRHLKLVRQETGERFAGVYFEHGAELVAELEAIDWMLRDVRQEKTKRMDPRLIELLRRVQADCGGRTLVVTSGFRTKATNDRLRRRGAVKNSLHLTGQAVDFYVPGLSPRRVARIAALKRLGGVGLYERRGFVHADVGEIRYWRG